MDQLNIILTVTVAGLLLSASPGPSMAYVLSRSVQFGHAGGLASSLGLAVGGMIHALLAALGLALLAVKFPWVLQILKYLGAAYLCYLGIDSLRAAFQTPTLTNESEASTEDKTGAESTRFSQHPWVRLFLNGMLIELTNPKTIIFFLSFMPQFITHFSTIGVFLLSSLIPLTAIPADLIAIFAGGLIAKKVGSNYWLVRLINGTVALILFAIAAFILLDN